MKHGFVNEDVASVEVAYVDEGVGFVVVAAVASGDIAGLHDPR